MKVLSWLRRLNNVFIVPVRVKETYNRYRSAVVHITQTGLLTGLGDIIAQHYVEKKTWNDHDIWRTVRLTSTGLFIIGPIFHVWYGVFLNNLYIQRTATTALKKVFLDQGLFAPVFLVMFYGSLGLMEMSPVKKTVNRLKTEFMPSMAVNYSVWPAVQMLNFYYIHKPQYNILLVNAVSIFWNSFLSWAAHRNIHTTTKIGKETVLPYD